MGWTKVREKSVHPCKLPDETVIEDHSPNDEWTCDYCQQVWIVKSLGFKLVLERKKPIIEV